MEIQAQYLMKCNLPIKQENLINERSSVLNPEKRNNANKILNSIICTHHRSLVGKGGPSSSERRQRWPSFRPRRGQGPFQDASSMSTYLTICNLLFKQEILQKKREVPYGIQEEKRNNANKILNSIICTHHRSLVGKGGPSSSERRQRGQAFVPGEARALSKMRAQ
jgi:hypothetical protein